MRHAFLIFFLSLNLIPLLMSHFVCEAIWGLAITVPVGLMALYDYLQPRHAIRRNFPLLGRLRYMAEAVRPGIQQYFVENDQEGRPFNKEDRSVVYQRAKGVLDTRPFGTIRDVYAEGYEWVNHSLCPKQRSQLS